MCVSREARAAARAVRRAVWRFWRTERCGEAGVRDRGRICFGVEVRVGLGFTGGVGDVLVNVFDGRVIGFGNGLVLTGDLKGLESAEGGGLKRRRLGAGNVDMVDIHM